MSTVSAPRTKWEGRVKDQKIKETPVGGRGSVGGVCREGGEGGGEWVGRERGERGQGQGEGTRNMSDIFTWFDP